MTFIDPATGWFEICQIANKSSLEVLSKLRNTWLYRYPKPNSIIIDNGTEFQKDFSKALKSMGIKAKLTTVKNPQANSVLERVHQVLGNMLRTKNLKKLCANKKEDVWDNILPSIAWAIRSTHHTTLGATPTQLVFGRDMVHPIQHVVEWDLIRTNKQHMIDTANLNENKSRVDWDYKEGDKVLTFDNDISRKLDSPTKGPYEIKQVHCNGTLTIQKDAVSDRINIRRCKPFFESNSLITYPSDQLYEWS